MKRESHICDSRRDLLTSAAAAVTASIAFVVYWRTLAPTVTGEDSGELIAAAYTLGIPHPPGYPLWCLLVHVFTYLPLNTVAWRVHLASASFASVAVFVIVLFVSRLTGKRLAGVLAGVTLAFGREFWEQSVIAEVYTLHALILALCLFCLWGWSATGKLRYIAACGALCGAGLGAHYTMVLLAPLFVVFIFGRQNHRPLTLPLSPQGRGEGTKPRCPVGSDLGTSVGSDSLSPSPRGEGKGEGFGTRRLFRPVVFGLCMLFGALVFLYLPIRSRANPAMDWGNPETLRNLLDVLLRRQFASVGAASPRSLIRFLEQLQAFASDTANALTLPLALGGVVGLLLLIRRDRAFGLLLIAIAMVTVSGAAYVQNFDQTREWLWVMSVFWIPAQMALAIGVGESVSRLPVGKLWPLVSMALVGSAGVLLLVSHYGVNDKSRYFWAEDYARNVLAALPANAVYVPRADHAVFPLLYLQIVEHARLDVTIARRYGYLDPEIFGERQALTGSFPKQRDEPRLLAWFFEHDRRPLYFSYWPLLPAALQGRIVPVGLLFRVLRPNDIAPGGVRNQPWRNRHDAMAYDDFTASLIGYEIHMADARAAFDNGSLDAGLNELEAALRVYGREPATLNNAGVTAARARQMETAENYFREALALDPANPLAARNLQRLTETGIR